MKHIVKGSEPPELGKWFNNQPTNETGKRINCGYDVMPSDVRTAIKKRLLKEQGCLCCYTGLQIDEASSHIEHFKPQKVCREEGGHEDIDYNNLLAAYPGDRAPKCRFGAHAKEDWYDPELTVSPLHKQCENKFLFTQFGGIEAATDTDLAAKETINRLGLDHEMLKDWREQAVAEFLFPDNKNLSKAKLQLIVDKGFCLHDDKDRYPRFCFVIEQVTLKLLQAAERDRRRRRAIQNKSRK